LPILSLAIFINSGLKQNKGNNMNKTVFLCVFLVALTAKTELFALEHFLFASVALNNTGQILPDTTVQVKITIFDNNILYTELFDSVRTNQFGMAYVEVGTGRQTSGDFADIKTHANTRIKFETSLDNITVLSTVQLISQLNTLNDFTFLWDINGNTGTDPSRHFIGTNDNAMLNIDIRKDTAIYQSLKLDSNRAIYREYSSVGAAGDKRGNFAVDFQIDRNFAYEIASGDYSVIAGGKRNNASADYGAIGGGAWNIVSSNFGAIGGGSGNQATGPAAAIAGGDRNIANDYGAFVGGGMSNRADGSRSTIAGGDRNFADKYSSTVGGGALNRANVLLSTIAGGYKNKTNGEYSTISGGEENETYGGYSTIAGGYLNIVRGSMATIGGGYKNRASGKRSVVAGGNHCISSGDLSFVGGGNLVRANGTYSAAAGGAQNNANGNHSFVGGGWLCQANGNYSAVLGGSRNRSDQTGATIGGGASNFSNGTYAVIGGGDRNQVNSNWGTVAGGRNNIVTATTALYAAIGGGELNNTNGSHTTIAGGYGNASTSNYAAVNGGFKNTAGASYSFVGGGKNNMANATFSTVGGGNGNTTSGDYASIAGGKDALAAKYGQTAYSSGKFSNAGDAQSSLFIVRNYAAAGATVDLYLDGSAQNMTVPNNTVWLFRALVVGTAFSASTSASWIITGMIQNSSGTLTISGVSLNQVSNPGSWMAPIAVINGTALVIRVTAPGSSTRWVARVETVEARY
jgi:hypothetical protein